MNVHPEQWPPTGYSTQPTGTGQLLVCLTCGALVGSPEGTDRHDEWHADESRRVHLGLLKRARREGRRTA